MSTRWQILDNWQFFFKLPAFIKKVDFVSKCPAAFTTMMDRVLLPFQIYSSLKDDILYKTSFTLMCNIGSSPRNDAYSLTVLWQSTTSYLTSPTIWEATSRTLKNVSWRKSQIGCSNYIRMAPNNPTSWQNVEIYETNWKQKEL